MMDNEPVQMIFRGYNKRNKLLFYECPRCEAPYDSFFFKTAKLKPNTVITCDCCGIDMIVPKYKNFRRAIGR